jgi:geranylgeranyl pyrophosphate synthase
MILEMLKSLDLVANELALVEEQMLAPDPERHNAVDDAVEQLINSGGKRFRPTISLLVAKMLDAPKKESVYLAAAVEMLHTATLVHDDIIDGALMRRGNPTLNATWSPGATILTGDYLFARAAALASQTKNVRVIRLFAEALMTVCNGELHQMFTPLSQAIERPYYFRRIFAKTGALFVLSSKATGILAGVSSKIEHKLNTFGTELGIAFQIVDDLLDFVGSESQVGKPLGSDLAQGLVTLPTICFLEENKDERILSVLNGQRKPENVLQALDLVRNSNAITQVKQEAEHHASLAKDALRDMPDNIYRQTLIELADYTINRRL